MCRDFKIPVLGKCLFCLDLRFGSLIIGNLSMIAGIIALITTLTTTNNNDASMEVAYKFQGNTNKSVTGSVILGFLMYFGFNLMLVIGIVKNIPFLVRCYYIYIMFAIFGCIVLFLFALFTLYFKASILILMSSALHCYYLVITRSAYFQMQEAKNSKSVQTTTSSA